jgi:2-methylcitrate dehydratase PrpD
MLAEEIADFAYRTQYADLPTEVAASVRRSLIDTLGVAIAAIDLDTSRAMRAYVERTWAEGPAEALGIQRPVPPVAAALLNGTLAHSFDFDDTHLPSVVHASACTIPAALAAAQASGARFADFLAAVAVGNEIACRLGMAGYDAARNLSLFAARGLHPTSTCGMVGAGAAAAKAMGLSREKLQHAIAIAVGMASGTIEPNRGGGNVKRIYCGWAAQAGVMAAEFANGGITGPASCLDGQFGFFAAYLSGECFPEAVTDQLGTRWEAATIGIKPYPCNIFTHSAIDAATELRVNGLDAATVDRILVALPSRVVPVVGEPIEAKRKPAGAQEARFSIPYTVASALLGGSGLGVAISDFEPEAIADPTRLALAAKVEVTAEVDMDPLYPKMLPAKITVFTSDGARSAAVETPRGSAVRPLTDADIRAKFTACVAGRMAPEQASAWLETLPQRETGPAAGLIAGLRA